MYSETTPPQQSPYIPLKEIGQLIGRPGLHHSTAYRWAVYGCDGVRLETVRFGKQHFVTREMLDAFGRALSEKSATDLQERRAERRATAPKPPKPITSTRRAKQIDAANKRLIEKGLMTASRTAGEVC